MLAAFLVFLTLCLCTYSVERFSVRVLGIDPGIAVTGYGVVEEKQRTLIPIGRGTINTSSQQSFSQRLGQLFQRVNDLIKDYKPELAV